jgi:hypothetical protein
VAVVRCRKCGAVVTASLTAEGIEASCGADMQLRCRSLADRRGADFIGAAAECAELNASVRAAVFRLRRRR